MKSLRKLYYKLFPTYRRLDFKIATYSDADALIRENEGKSESEQWVIAKEEDANLVSCNGMKWFVVYLERRERIFE